MRSGDRFRYDIDGRTGTADEFLSDGEAFVTWDDGTFGNIHWNSMTKLSVSERREKSDADRINLLRAWESLNEDDPELGDDCKDLADRFALLSRQYEELRKALDAAEKSLHPMFARVFNDNHELTVNTLSFSYDEIVAAYFTYKKIKSALSSAPSPSETEKSDD